MNHLKVVLLVIVWVLLTGFMMTRDERQTSYLQLAIPANEVKSE